MTLAWCFLILTYTPDWNGSLHFSPSPELLQLALLGGSCLILFGVVGLLAAHYGIPSSVKGSMTKIWSKVSGAGFLTRISGKKKSNGVGVYGTIGFCLAFGLALTVVLWAARPQYETVTEHNVKVFRQLGENEWAMQSDEQGYFVFRGCEDFPNADVIWAGFIADKAKWEERGKCKSIRRSDLGFWWRDHHDFRRIN